MRASGFANPGLTPSFRRTLPETGCLSQGLPHGKRYAWPCSPKTVRHTAVTPTEHFAPWANLVQSPDFRQNNRVIGDCPRFSRFSRFSGFAVLSRFSPPVFSRFSRFSRLVCPVCGLRFAGLAGLPGLRFAVWPVWVFRRSREPVA